MNQRCLNCTTVYDDQGPSLCRGGRTHVPEVPAEVLPRPAHSRLTDLYKTEEFQAEWKKELSKSVGDQPVSVNDTMLPEQRKVKTSQPLDFLRGPLVVRHPQEPEPEGYYNPREALAGRRLTEREQEEESTLP